MFNLEHFLPQMSHSGLEQLAGRQPYYYSELFVRTFQNLFRCNVFFLVFYIV